MNISNALGKWEKKFLEGLFGDEKDRTKTLALSSWPWLEFFKGRGGEGGTYHSHPTSMLHYPVFFLMDNSSA